MSTPMDELTPDMLREHAKAEQTIAWEGQARQLLLWAADLLEAAIQMREDTHG